MKYIPPPFKSVIIDFSALTYIDASGVSALKIIIKELNSIMLNVCLAGCSSPVYEMLKKCDFFNNQANDFKVFPTVLDAVLYVEELLHTVNVGNV